LYSSNLSSDTQHKTLLRFRRHMTKRRESPLPQSRQFLPKELDLFSLRLGDVNQALTSHRFIELSAVLLAGSCVLVLEFEVINLFAL